MTDQKERHVDVVIIGAGTAGLNARRSALAAGAKSALLIENGPYGTTCARIGCMPSKLLIHAANVVHEAKIASEAGIHAEITIQGHEVLQRVQRERDRFVGFVIEATENIPEDQRLIGTASFLDNNTLEVDGEKISFRSAVIATGSRNNIPPIFQDLIKNTPHRILTNENVFELETLPKSVAVFGMGVIGLELGQAFTRLGVKTQFFGRHNRFAGTSDPRVYDTIKTIIGEDLHVTWDSEVIRATGNDSGVTLTWKDANNQEHQKTFEYLLLTAGRRPNIDSLKLENTSLPLNNGFPTINFITGQAGESNIFFAGDVTGERALLHEAADEGRHAGMNAAIYPNIKERTRRTPLMVTFTDPNIAIAGQSYAQLVEQQTHGRLEFAAGEVSYYGQGRARVMQKNRGIVRMYADKKSRKLLGMEGIAPSLEHMANAIAWIIQLGATVDDALQLPFYHPVTEEGLRTCLQDLQANLDK